MSSRIAYLEKQIAARKAFSEDTLSWSQREPESKAAQFFSVSDRGYLNELQHELYIEKSIRDKELLDVRLHGDHIKEGSIPLKLLAKFSLPFVEAVEHAAHRLHTGSVAHTIGKDLSNLMDIQLSGLAAGSARLQIIGNLAPDLAGSSVLENTLHQLFRLLSIEDDFYDAIDSVGGKSAHKLANALNSLNSNGVLIDMTWSTPDGKIIRWDATSDMMSCFITNIEALSEPETLSQSFTGFVRSISDTGYFDIKDSKENRIRIGYAMNQRDLVEMLHIWQEVSVSVRTERRYDNITHQPKDKHHLVTLTPKQQKANT